MKLIDRNKARMKRHKRIRRRVSGTGERPRLVVFRSLKNVEGQIVDDEKGVTLVGFSSLSKEMEESRKKKLKGLELSRLVGERLAVKALEKGITKVVFDRGGYLYHGRVKAFAEGARKGGLNF